MTSKIDKKAAKKLAREKKLIQHRKDTLEREEALDQNTLNKIKEKWYQTLLNNKIPEMQDNLRHILHYMEKLVEADSFRKLMFEEERQEINEAWTLQAKSHSSALDVLFDIYKNRIQDLETAYNHTVTLKKSHAEEEFTKLEENEAKIQENMQTMLFIMQQNQEKKEEAMNCDMFLKLDDERSKNTEMYENLRSKLEKKMEKRWGEIMSTLTNYNTNTQQRRTEYLQLKAKDDADSKIIFQQMKKTQKIFEQLEILKNCCDNCYAPRETLRMIADVREEKAKFFDTFKQLKYLLAEELKIDETNLKNLTVISNQITKDLKKICAKGEQILTLFRICRKFETESEKVIPIGSTLNLARQAEISEPKKGTEETIISYYEPGNSAKDYEVLGKFWKKFGKVRLSVLALKKCIKDLEKENAILKKSLVSYLKEVSSTKKIN